MRRPPSLPGGGDWGASRGDTQGGEGASHESRGKAKEPYVGMAPSEVDPEWRRVALTPGSATPVHRHGRRSDPEAEPLAHELSNRDTRPLGRPEPHLTQGRPHGFGEQRIVALEYLDRGRIHSTRGVHHVRRVHQA